MDAAYGDEKSGHFIGRVSQGRTDHTAKAIKHSILGAGVWGQISNLAIHCLFDFRKVI